MSRVEAPDISLAEFRQLMAPYGEDYGLYVPSDRVIQHIHGVDLLLGAGPAGVGKDTILSRTGFPKVTSDTTRPERENDGVMEIDGKEYWFRERQVAYKDIVEKNYVQIVSGVTGELYGSRDSVYPQKGVAVMDVLVTAIPRMRALPFKSVRSMYFVAPPKPYIARLDGRGILTPEERIKRLNEGEESLVIGLDDRDMPFIVNEQGKLDTAVGHVLEIAKHGHYDSQLEKQARKVGHQMLRGIRRELGLPIVYPLS